jgi:anthranilate synthase
LGFVDPLLCFWARDKDFSIDALNERGALLLPAVHRVLASEAAVADLAFQPSQHVRGTVQATSERFAEEQRSRQPSVFSVVRRLVELFGSQQDHHLGLYGAFGYDLCFQFEPTDLVRERPADQRDLVLYLPDNLIVVDRQKERASRLLYDFEVDGRSTFGIERSGPRTPYAPASGVEERCDHAPGEYADSVRRAKESFKRGDLFELVLSQTFTLPCIKSPTAIFEHLKEHNPAPYALLLNLGESEYLVGASPEMYVRVDGRRVETCPISGTIERGSDPIEDAERIRELLASKKDESELTMCTDVDRNDKSRICEPGSVKVLGRRQIELYSRLIHTVDHVEGQLRPEFDALDAFLSHTWAVTVTGAPKPAAIQRVERDEKSPRAWYGGAIGVIGFDGNLNTGLTLRTVRLKNGVAEVRAGATLLFDSDPEAEERETRVKASAFLDSIQRGEVPTSASSPPLHGGEGLHLLLVDHEDSFVHTLANYFRQTGAKVTTLRYGFDPRRFDELAANFVVLSPGPGTPEEFNLSTTIAQCLERDLPIFGVCLGLQGLVEYFGGALGVLDYPMHGKPSIIHAGDSELFNGLPQAFQAGRYHSLYAKREHLPECLSVTAETADGVVMAIEHCNLPIAAVQFHPESILSQGGGVGVRLLDNAVRALRPRSKMAHQRAAD